MPAETPTSTPDTRRTTGGPIGRPDLGALAADLSMARLASGTRDNLVGTVVERILGIGLFLALPFLLTPRELGTYYEVIAMVTLLVILGVLGIDAALVRFTALAAERRRLGDARPYFVAGSRITIGTSVGLAAALWLAAPWLAAVFGSSDFVWPARLGAVAIPFLVRTFVLVAPARGVKLMWPTVLATQVFQPGIALLATLALVLSGLGLTGAVTGFAVAATVSWVLAEAMVVRLRLPREATRAEPAARGPLVRFALPIAGMTLTGTALLWIDTLLLGAFRPASEVATYGIIVRLLSVGSAVLLTVIQIFGPFVTQLVARGDSERLRDVLRTATRWVVLVSAPPLALLAISGDTVLRVFHQPTSQGRMAMAVLAAAFLFDAFSGPVGHVLTMSGRSWLNLANNAASLGCNVVLNIALVPSFGLMGAAMSWAIVIVGINVVRIFQVRSIFGVTPFHRSLLRLAVGLLVGSSGAAAARLLFRGLAGAQPLAHLAVMGAAFIAAYVAALAALGSEPEDRMFWRTLLRSPSGRTTIEPAGSGGRSGPRHLTRTGSATNVRRSS